MTRTVRSRSRDPERSGRGGDGWICPPRLVGCFLVCAVLVTACNADSDAPARDASGSVGRPAPEVPAAAQEVPAATQLAQGGPDATSPSADGDDGREADLDAIGETGSVEQPTNWTTVTSASVPVTEAISDLAALAVDEPTATAVASMPEDRGVADAEPTGDEADAEPDAVPEISARDKALAWLADDSMLESFPATTARTGQGAAVSRLVLPEERLTFTRPADVRGLYVNAWGAGSNRRSQALIDLATRTEINTLVIDVKDASGYVSYPTRVATARDVGADQEIRIRDLVGLVERLHHADIYPIARIVIVKDPLLVRGRPDLAVQDTAGGVWVDGKGLIWANLHHKAVWEYHVELAKEVAAAGFPEIQWDYLRFPDAPREELDRAVFPGADGRMRRDAVEAFLDYARAELAESGVEMTLDVFGATTSATTDIGIGQYWERFIGSVDVALPMVYPSHYWAGSFAIQDPNGHPYEIVRAALRAALERSDAVEGAGTTRPWLQDFTLGSPRYGAPEVRAQIQATYDAGIREWVLWNASSRYTEAALAPAGGYPPGMEPTIRVGGRIVPVSERYEAMDAEALALAVAEAAARAEAERVEREKAAADTTGIVILPDTILPDTVGVQR